MGLVWLIGVVVRLLAANHGSSCSLTRAMDGCILCCGIISLCQLAAIFEIVKVLLATSSSHVRSAIASTGLYLYFTFLPLPFYLYSDAKLLAGLCGRFDSD